MLEYAKNFFVCLRLALLLAVLSSPGLSLAAESQYYLVARKAPAGSLTAPGQGQQVVYIRWDAVEGELPASVVKLKLLRDGVAVVDPAYPDGWPVGQVRSIAAINELYAGPAQQRRKLETITRLNELATAEGETFSASQFAARIHDLIDPANLAAPDEPYQLWNYNPLWAYLGSRTDINIARARLRGWIDTTPATGSVTYELLGINAAGVEARLGLVAVDLNTPQQPLGATNLHQVLISDTRCDYPEAGKDQYTIMLDWNQPGAANLSDKVAAQSYISGFDIYRSSANLAANVLTAPVRDIAAEAAGVNHDSRGIPALAGLEKVNVSLLTDPGAANGEPKWVEARDLLQRAGLKPGDRRAYYLVSRDFTGNYGPTTEAVVEVPSMTRPPAPWNLRSFADQTSSVLTPARKDSLTFTWDKVNLENYMRMYQNTRLFCNVVEAQQTGILDYVGLDEDCATGVRNSVRLDVIDYKIYRFTDFDLAGRFKDSDGDGYSDEDEIPDLNNDKKRDELERSQGTQCDATKPPVESGKKNYLVWSPEPNKPADTDVELLSTELPRNVRMRDAVPAGDKDRVYWYRIASVASTPVPNGRLSFLSAPQRGLFPDRTPPLEPDVKVTRPETEQGCEVITDPNGTWSFDESLSDEDGDPKGEKFSLSCGDDFSIDSLQWGSIRTTVGSKNCGDIAAACDGKDVDISFPGTDKTGGQVCDVTIKPTEADFCDMGSVSLVPTEFELEIDIQPGELVYLGPKITVTPPAGKKTCISLYENMDGTVTRIANTCDGNIVHWPRIGEFCGYAVATDENNNISGSVHIPCTLSPANPKAPAPPQILNLDVDDQLARFSFRLPAEEVAATIVRLNHEPGDGSSERQVATVPVIDNEAGAVISYSLPVEALQVTKDRFCLSMLAVGRDEGNGDNRNSDWSAERCFTRTSSGQDLPVYMPWPDVAAPAEGPALKGGLLNGYRAIRPFLMLEMLRSGELLDDCERLLPGQIPNGEPPITPESEMTDFDRYECTSAGMAQFNGVLGGELNFILYRQRRIQGGGELSDWVQVTPLIDYIHFERIVPPRGTEKGSSPIEWSLADPFFRTSLLSGAGPEGEDEIAVWFLDRYPYLLSKLTGELYEWRYQAVYFDSSQRPVKWRQTDWFRDVE